MNTIDRDLRSSWGSQDDESRTMLHLDEISNCATDGHHPVTGCLNCPCEFDEEEIFEWFRMKGIRHGSPEDALSEHIGAGRGKIECLSLGGGKLKGKGKVSILARRMGTAQVEQASS